MYPGPNKHFCNLKKEFILIVEILLKMKSTNFADTKSSEYISIRGVDIVDEILQIIMMAHSFKFAQSPPLNHYPYEIEIPRNFLQ